MRLKRVWSSGVLHVSSLVALSLAVHLEHLIFLIHSSFYDTRTRSTIGTTRASPRTPVHHAHLQAPSVDKLRHQESLWREDLQSGGNPRTTTPTGYEPKELATVSRIEAYSGDPSPITEEVEEFGEIGVAGLSNSKNTRDVLLPIADAFRRFRGKHCRFWSRRWRVTKDADFTTVCPESLGETRCNGRAQERQVSAQYTQADRKECLRAHSSEGQKALERPYALFSSEQGNLIRSSVFRIANPSNVRGSLLEGNKDHLLNQASSDLAKQELHVESRNKCVGELQRQMEEQRLALQDAQYGFVESRR